jgi:hypothetical protein
VHVSSIVDVVVAGAAVVVAGNAVVLDDVVGKGVGAGKLEVVELSTDVVVVISIEVEDVVGKGVGSGMGVGAGVGSGIGVGVCAAAGGAIARLQHKVKPISVNTTRVIKEYLYLIIDTPQFSDQWF